MNTKHKAPFYCIALLFLAITIADTYLWISITNEYETFEKCKEVYLSHFPLSIRNARLLTVFSIALSGIATVIFIKSIEQNYLKLTSIFLALVAGLHTVWHIFSLM
jgi:hypothetical protein